MATRSRLPARAHARIVLLVIALGVGALGGASYAPSGVAAADLSVQVQEDGNCPTGYPVKALMDEEGERTAYVSDDPIYEAISPAVCFASDVAAVADGYQLHPH